MVNLIGTNCKTISIVIILCTINVKGLSLDRNSSLCSNSLNTNQDQNQSSCRLPVDDVDAENDYGECSQRGVCVCGICECFQRQQPNEMIYGQFCECDNFSCERQNGEICSGPQNGICECGFCSCHEGFTGTACQCTTNTTTCVEPGTTKTCNDMGSCDCGYCNCNPTKGYTGKFCEICETSECQNRGEEYQECVNCTVFGLTTVQDCEEICKNSPRIETIEKIPEFPKPIGDLIQVIDKDNCRFKYLVKKDEGRVYIQAEKFKLCLVDNHPPFYWIFAGFTSSLYSLLGFFYR